MERERAKASLHERIGGALRRAALVQEDSRALIAESEVVRSALRTTVAASRERRDARLGNRPEK